MRTKIIFDTPKEYFEARREDRVKGDTSPVVPYEVTVVFDHGDRVRLEGDGSEKFGLASEITQSSMIAYALDYAGVKVRWGVDISEEKLREHLTDNNPGDATE